jgi:hypothetical protein
MRMKPFNQLETGEKFLSPKKSAYNPNAAPMTVQVLERHEPGKILGINAAGVYFFYYLNENEKVEVIKE